ncbi:MAG: NAD-dependent epimerase/dehydratase family protein [Hyphomicrobiaceae bacterium]
MIGVYGANGFIGRHLLARLARSGERCRAVSRRFDDDVKSEFGRRFELVEADFRDPIAMASTLQAVNTVVQLISTSSPGLQNRYLLNDIRENVIPHVDFVRSAVEAGAKRYVFVSSGGTVYGPGAPVPIPESAPTRPISSHGISKLTIEQYLHLFAHVEGLSAIVLRVANAYGPGQKFRKGNGLIPAVRERIERDEPVQIIGDGSMRRDYVYVADVAEAIMASVSRRESDSVTVNIGSGHAHSVKEVVDLVERIVGRPVKREFVPARKSDVDVSLLDITRAQEILGWKPRVDFEDGLARTFASST